MENKNFQNKFYWVYLIGFFLILSLPFWAIPPLFHPPAWGKTIIFRIILSCLIFFFIYQIIYRKNAPIFEKLKSKPVRLVLGILILLIFLFLLSTIFSPEKSFSLWGNPYRAGGFLNFAFYIIFAILIFLILKPRGWKLIWNLSLGTALLVSLLALLQQSKVFEEFLVPYGARIPATLGSPVFLALYLSFFIFLSLSFAISEKNKKKKILYFLSFLIIIFVIFLTGTRAVFLGIAVAFLYFILLYPKKIKFLKLATLIFLALGILGVYYINTPSEKISSLPFVIKNPALPTLLYRFNIKLFLEDPRFSFWKIAVNSMEERPLLGYGPENFSIAFDKYYDPSLPHLEYMTISQVDRAHGFIFDTAVTVGIPALITFLLLFGVLFWQLQKLKSADIRFVDNYAEKTPKIILHGIQATIIAYFIGVFFSFDTFDTYLLFFLIVAYSLYLIQNYSSLNNTTNRGFIRIERIYADIAKHRKIIIGFLFFVLVWFIWFYNLKPLFINKELNWAEYYSTNGKCQKAIDKMEKVLPSHSFIDNYVLLKYSEVLKDCQKTNPEKEKELIQKSIQILEEAVKLRPTYTRTWILLGGYLNFYVENNQNLKPEEKEELLLKTDSYFAKALQLNPKGQIIFLERSNTYLLWGKYDEAKKIAEQCIEINSNLGSCWAQKALANITLGELTQAKENLETASQKGFNIDSKSFLTRLLKAYSLLIKNSKEINLQYYQPLVNIYQRLIVFEPNNFQYHASLAYVYKILGEYKKAKEEALIVIELSPESKANVEEFLKTLPY